MKIAVVSSYLTSQLKGGAEHYVEMAASSLAARHDVVVLSGSDPRDIEVPHVRLPGMAPLGERRMLQEKVIWHLRDQWRRPVHQALVDHLRRLEPDVVKTNNIQGLSAAVFSAIAEVGLPHVHVAHDLSLLCVRTSMVRGGRPCRGACADCKIQRAIRTVLVRRSADRIVTVSSAIRQHLVAARVLPADHISTIRLGTVTGSPVLRTWRQHLRIGFLGTLTRQKGLLTLLEAVRTAPSDWSFVIAGRGPLENTVRQTASVDPRVSYIGHVDGEAKELLLDALDLVVIPSELEEAASFVAVEAAARGIPAVVSDRGGLPETPEARVFRAGSAADLLAAIHWFGDADRLARASARLVERHQEFLWPTHVERLERVLHEAVADHPSHD